MKPLDELINLEEPGWELIDSWIKEAKNKVEVLQCSKEDGEAALYNTQVTTRSPMGAIAYQTGGLLIDYAWIRIFGAGCERLPISLPAWNKGKTIDEFGESASFWIVADDVIGGIFAINGGQFGDDLGKMYYFPMDSLEWEDMEMTYSDFIWWCFTGDLDKYYEGKRWEGWQDEIAKLPGDKVMSFYPYLFCEAKSLEARHREPIPINESYGLFVGEVR